MRVLAAPGLGFYPVDKDGMLIRDNVYDELRERGIKGYTDPGPLFIEGDAREERFKKELRQDISEMRLAITQLRDGSLRPDILPDWSIDPELLKLLWFYPRPISQGSPDLVDLIRLHEKEREVNLPEAIKYYVNTYQLVKGGELPPPTNQPLDTGDLDQNAAPIPGADPRTWDWSGEPLDYTSADGYAQVLDQEAAPAPEPKDFPIDQAVQVIQSSSPEALAELLPAMLERTKDSPAYTQRLLDAAGVNAEAGLPEAPAQEPAPEPTGLIDKTKKGGEVLIWVGAVAGGLAAIASLYAMIRRKKR